MDTLLGLSEGIRRLLERIALISGWLLVVMACVTTFDVLARKMGAQLPYTKLQELEWHFHAAIFSLWMGYCYTINAHPRVDSFTEHLSYRSRAWIELAGCLVLALPYMALVAYFDFVARSTGSPTTSRSSCSCRCSSSFSSAIPLPSSWAGCRSSSRLSASGSAYSRSSASPTWCCACGAGWRTIPCCLDPDVHLHGRDPGAIQLGG